MDGNHTAYHWERKDSTKADVHIIATDSPEEAAATLHKRMDRISVGPTAKLKGIGDEAYIYISPNRDIGIVRFRKGNLFIVVSASKSAIAKKFSEDIAAAVP